MYEKEIEPYDNSEVLKFEKKISDRLGQLNDEKTQLRLKRKSCVEVLRKFIQKGICQHL